MSYFAGHMKKLGRSDLKWAQIHNQREKPSRTNREIDRERTRLNYDLANEGDIHHGKRIDQAIEKGVTSKRKIRSDAVLCCSWVITSDKGFFDRIGEQEERRFFQEAYSWFADRYGKENIAYAVVHKDEHTPHMHVGVVPITKDGRLAAKDRFNRQELRSVQEEFPKYIQAVGFDLQRGIPSDQKHMEPVRYKNQQLLESVERLKNAMVQGSRFMSGLRKDRERLEQEVRSLKQLEEKARNVYDMEEKPAGWFGMDKERIRVKTEDWEGLKNQALYTARLQSDYGRLEKENGLLRGHMKKLGSQVEGMRRELGQLREVAKDYKELEQYVEELELKLDLIEQELEMEFDIDFDDLELDDEGLKRKRGRRGSGRPKLKQRRRPKEQQVNRHQRARQKQPTKARRIKRDHGKIIDRGRF